MSLGLFNSPSECVYIHIILFLSVFFSHRTFIGCRYNDWETIITKQQLLFITVDEAKRLVKLNRALLILLTRGIEYSNRMYNVEARLSYWFKVRKNMLTDHYIVKIKRRRWRKTLWHLSICSVASYFSLSLSLMHSYDWMLAHTYTY
jgi:hypothetical protein